VKLIYESLQNARIKEVTGYHLVDGVSNSCSGGRISHLYVRPSEGPNRSSFPWVLRVVSQGIKRKESEPDHSLLPCAEI
jgi:hypothetical protein